MDRLWRFTPEMGAQLRKLRARAGLTLDEVAARMGLSGRGRRNHPARLERGAKANPDAATLILYLKACGAKMNEFFGQFDAVEFVKVRGNLDKVWDAAEVKVAPTGRRSQASALAEVKAGLERKAEMAARRYQLNVPAAEPPGKTAPKEVARRAAKLAEYRMQTSLVERKVQDYLDELKVPVLIRLGYAMFARSVFSVVRKASGKINTEAQRNTEARRSREDQGDFKSQIANSKLQSNVAKSEVRNQKAEGRTGEKGTSDCRLTDKRLQDKLAAKWTFVEEQGLEPEIAKRVQEIVIAEWERIKG